jgi:hypothetical protein
MAVADPEAWVRTVERLYQSHDAAGVAALYAPGARTKFGSRVLTPQEVHDHPAEWFDSLDDYEITRTFRAAFGDIIVSETTASYVIRAEGRKCREFGVDIYWVNDHGLIYHKHTCEVVDDYRDDDLDAAAEACAAHPGAPA